MRSIRENTKSLDFPPSCYKKMFSGGKSIFLKNYKKLCCLDTSELSKGGKTFEA